MVPYGQPMIEAYEEAWAQASETSKKTGRQLISNHPNQISKY